MSHFKVYYSECSQNEQKRINKKLLEENEVLEERILLANVDCLPKELQNIIGDFSVVVKQQRALVRLEFFDRWVIENTDRIMGLIEGWSKPHVGFVLNSIVNIEYPGFDGYLKGNYLYKCRDAKHMRKKIKINISHRTKEMRPDIIEVFRDDRIWPNHRFVPCRVNPAFDECPPIRIYGAYKAIEEYDTRMKMKKRKSSK